MEDKEAFEKIVAQIASLNCKPNYVLITKVDALLMGYSNFRDLGNGWVEIDLTKDHDINRFLLISYNQITKKFNLK